MKIYIIAGEASGDNIGAKLMRELKKQNKDIEFYGIGGNKMQANGMNLFFPSQELSLMGFFEVLPHILRIKIRIKQTIEDIKQINPDVVITIDSPGFCFRVAKAVKNQIKAKLVHYVAPTVWAYRPKRAKEIAKIYDHLLVILPFEPKYFTKEGLDTTFVGHPAIEDIQANSNEVFRYKHKVPKGNLLLCLTPGSRKQEIKLLLPIFLDAIKLFCQSSKQKITIALPTSQYLRPFIESYMTSDLEIIIVNEEEKYDLFSAADLSLTKSGTITTELAFYHIPMVVAHKVNAFSHWLLKRFIKIKYASIINLLAEKEVIPELLQDKCKADIIAKQLIHMMDSTHRNKMMEDVQTNLDKLHIDNESPSSLAAEKILSIIKE